MFGNGIERGSIVTDEEYFIVSKVTVEGQVILSRFSDLKGESGPLIDCLNFSLKNCGVGG